MERCRLALGLQACLVGMLAGLSAAWAADDEESLADTTFPQESIPTQKRLEAADKLAAAGKWTEAMDEYRRIMADAGSVLIPVDSKNRRRSIRARRLIQIRLTSRTLSGEALRLYRKRCDDKARAWLKQGKAGRDVRALRRIVDEAFRSSVTEQALDLLGDLAFERGCFEEARYWWRIIAAPAGEAARTSPAKRAIEELRLPDGSPDGIARARAKQIVARLFQGDRFKLDEDVRAFAKLHPDATGELAGDKGRYAAIVEALVAKTLAQPPLQDDDIWTTFGGNPTRNLLIPTPMSARIGVEGARWSARFDTGTVEVADETGAGPPPEDAFLGRPEALAFYPVIAGSLVLWADARYVNAHDLLTGRRVFRYDLLGGGTIGQSVLQGVELGLPAHAGLRYSLSVANDRAFVRLGTQTLAPRKELRADPRNTFVVCLDLKPKARKRARWQVAANVLDTDALVFEGAPLVHEDRVYAVLSRIDTAQTASWIVCFDRDTGKEQWRQAVCETKTPKGEAGDLIRFRHHLLCLAGANVVFCSHAGAVAAVDAVTGQPAWAFRYASRGARTADGGPSPRDLAPCLSFAGRIFVAPLDSDRLLCVDADTGKLLWDLDATRVVHMLGVAEGRLVFTTRTGIRAVAAASGEEEKGQGWSQPGEGKLPGFGRGFLAGGWVFFPVAPPLKHPLRVLNVQDGTFERGDDIYDPSSFYRLARGNLTFGNGCLAIAGTERLWVYVPERRYLPMRKAAAASAASSQALYRLALAEADAGLHGPAIDDFARAEKALPGEKYQGVPLRELARRARHRAFLEWARSESAAKRWTAAATLLTRAAATDFSPTARAEALCRLGDTWARAAEPAKAVAAWQALLADPTLHFASATRKPDAPRSASSFAIARIEEQVRVHGTDVYAPFERQAAALLASANGRDNVPILERLGREYPNASAMRISRLRLARIYDQEGKLARAARAYRMVLRHGQVPPLTADDLALARVGLARAYERLQRYSPARLAWQDLADHSGDRLVPTPEGKRKASAIAADALRNPQYGTSLAAVARSLRFPLARTWEEPPFSWKKTEPIGRLLVPDIVLPMESADDSALFLKGAAPAFVLECRDAATGKRCWQIPIRDAPDWTAQLGGVAILAASRGILCVGLREGTRLWELRSPPLPLVGYFPSGSTRFSAFQITTSHLYCLEDERRLLAIDVDTGEVVWSQRTPGAAIRPLYPAGRFMAPFHADEEFLVVQAGSGKRLILDSRTGRALHELPGSRDLWPRPPLALGEQRLCLVPDATRIVMLRPDTGKTLWTYDAVPSAQSTLVSGEAPRLFGRHEVLFALLARNYGYQLERLDPQTGASLWEKGARLVRECPANVDFDGDALYYVSRDLLSARSLKTGKLIWSRQLNGPPGAWRVVACQGHVMAYPARLRVEPRWRLVPTGSSAIALPLRVWRGAGLTMLICSTSNGALVQRFHFPGLRPQAAVQVFRHRAVVEVDGHACGLADARIAIGSK
jgi:outer membrane protein assembly factor BamB